MSTRRQRRLVLAAVLLALAALAALWLRWGEAVFVNQLGALLC